MRDVLQLSNNYQLKNTKVYYKCIWKYQISISNVTTKSPIFKTCELYNVMVSAEISFNKLINQCYHEILEKYTKYNILDDSTLRKNYLFMYIQLNHRQLPKVLNLKIWISIDETTDIEGHYNIAHVKIGILH